MAFQTIPNIDPSLSTATKVFSPFNFDDLCNIDAIGPTGVIDFDHFTDRSLPGLDDHCNIDPATLQTGFPSPFSLGRDIANSPSSGKQSVSTLTFDTAEHASKIRKNTGGSPKSRSGRVNGDGVHKSKASQRPHYAVETRYRSKLNEKYATLARLLSQQVTQRICRTDAPEWTVQLDSTTSPAKNGQETARCQSKTATLTVALNAIQILERCCSRKAKDADDLRGAVRDIGDRVQQVLGSSEVRTSSGSRSKDQPMEK